MAIAIDPKQVFDYVLKADRGLPKGEQTMFKLGCLTVREEASLQDNLFTMGMEGATGELSDAKVNSGSRIIDVLKFGLRGWENFKDAAGGQVPFLTNRIGGTRGARDEVTDESLDRLHPDWRVELANAITERNQMTEEEVKNS